MTDLNKEMKGRKLKIDGIYRHFNDKYHIIEHAALYSEPKGEYVAALKLY